MLFTHLRVVNKWRQYDADKGGVVRAVRVSGGIASLPSLQGNPLTNEPSSRLFPLPRNCGNFIPFVVPALTYPYLPCAS